MLTPCQLHLSPDAVIVGTQFFPSHMPGEANMEIIVLGDFSDCQEAITKYKGSISQKLHGIKLAAEDIFDHQVLTPGVCRFILG